MYRSFLLRVWRQPDGRARASVEDVDTGEVDTFDQLDELCGWLEHRVDEAPPEGGLNRSEHARRERRR